MKVNTLKIMFFTIKNKNKKNKDCSLNLFTDTWASQDCLKVFYNIFYHN